MDGRRLKVTAALWEELTRLGISAWQWGGLGVELGTYVKVWGEKEKLFSMGEHLVGSLLHRSPSSKLSPFLPHQAGLHFPG